MYRENHYQMILPEEFFLPFAGHLNPENRWCVLAQIVPWGRIEQEYRMLFEYEGAVAFSVRVALGSLIIQQRLKLSDRDTVEMISENPYLQYFIGFPGFIQQEPFHPSLMVHFRKRFDVDTMNQINEWIVAEAEKRDKENKKDEDQGSGSSSSMSGKGKRKADSTAQSNQGKLMLDATCTPADIAFPTDLSLLNEARGKLEEVIDILHSVRGGSPLKPRTYRKKARRQFLSVIKQRRPNARMLRKAIGQQLRFVRRNLAIVTQLRDEVGLSALSRNQRKQLMVIHELYRQQEEMYRTKSHRIDERIVSISQPHVRPIVRGKAKANVEFGAKVSISLVNGYALMERLDWNSYAEGSTLVDAAEAYYERYGFYPEAILADKAYRTRENLGYCKEHGIRLSGPALGRPKRSESKAQKRVELEDSAQRNAVEGKFGEGKRRYGLGLIRTRLEKTSETAISLGLMVMNLEKILRDFFLPFFVWLILGTRSLNLGV